MRSGTHPSADQLRTLRTHTKSLLPCSLLPQECFVEFTQSDCPTRAVLLEGALDLAETARQRGMQQGVRDACRAIADAGAC